MAKAHRLHAQLLFSVGRENAASAATRAIELGESLIRQNHAPNTIVGECAVAYVVAGEIAMRANPPAANAYWHRALEVVAPKLPGAKDWRLLDPAARATFFTGHVSDAIAMMKQLGDHGYVPLDPWPEAAINSTPPKSQ